MSSEIREKLYYTREHEWILIDEGIATVGITDFAQQALGDLVFVELPEADTLATVSEQLAVVEFVKAASEVYSPVSGKIIEVNEELEDMPESINNNPFDDGWICKIAMSDMAELDELMDADDYTTYLEGLE